jgi:hypothetical protein
MHRYHPTMPRKLVLLLVLLLGSMAAAQTRPADETILGELANESYETRQRATQALLADDGLTVDDLKRLYAASTLPEQRHRLLDAAQHHFVRSLIEAQFPPTGEAVGSLGISLLKSVGPTETPEGPDAGRTAARIGLTYPGFPAYVWLRAGDLIVAVNGATLPTTDDPDTVQRRFIELVQKNKAGQSIKLTVYREGQRLEVSVKLAPYKALQVFYEQAELSLMPNIAARWDGLRRQIVATHPDEKAIIPNLDKVSPVSPPEPSGSRVNPTDTESDRIEIPPE